MYVKRHHALEILYSCYGTTAIFILGLIKISSSKSKEIFFSSLFSHPILMEMRLKELQTGEKIF
jgi:hypothetical protein